MNNINYVVSNLRELWDNSDCDIFISDPYIEHILKKQHLEKNYNYEIADHIRKDAKDLEQHDHFVDKKYKKYIKIISDRLNTFHIKKYDEYFWRKALSLGLIRYITSLHNSFVLHEKYYSDIKHYVNIIPEEIYFYPEDFEELRHCLQNSDFGQELMFSMYLRVKGYSNYKYKRIKKFDISKNEDVLNKLKKKIKSIYYRYINRLDKVAILGSYFKKSSLKKLHRLSIKNIVVPVVENKTDKINKEAREFISKFENDFDDFDRYFFFSLKYLLPKIYLENYYVFETTYLQDLNRHSKLEYIVCENFIGNTQNSLYLALANTLNISHIANEHNCLYHPYLGSYIENVIDLCDTYLTIGWTNENYDKVISSSSLFNFYIPSSSEKKIDLLFISGAVLSKMQHYSGAYGYCQEHAEANIIFNKEFFSNINLNNKFNLAYREYPKNKLNHLQCYDKEIYYSEYLNNFDYTDTSQITSKEQISKSNLVVIDYISTSFIESLLMDVPTIFFFNKKCYHLKEKYASLFDELIDANICQINPIKAANFVEATIHNPGEWWNSTKVKTAKDNFLKNNINTSDILINYLKNL